MCGIFSNLIQFNNTIKRNPVLKQNGLERIGRWPTFHKMVWRKHAYSAVPVKNSYTSLKKGHAINNNKNNKKILKKIPPPELEFVLCSSQGLPQFPASKRTKVYYDFFSFFFFLLLNLTPCSLSNKFYLLQRSRSDCIHLCSNGSY